MRIGAFSVFDYLDTLTVEQADAAQDAELALDYKQSTQWDISSYNSVSFWVELTEAQPGHFIGIVGHNLGSQGITVAVESKALVGDSWESRLAATAISDDHAKLLAFDSNATHAFWRVTFAGDNIQTYITHISLGQLLNLPAAYAPITPPGIVQNRSQAFGAIDKHYLGKRTRNDPIKLSITVKNLPLGQFDSLTLSMSELLTQAPFFYAWNETDYPNECFYCWAEKGAPLPNFSGIKYGDYSIPVVGVR